MVMVGSESTGNNPHVGPSTEINTFHKMFSKIMVFNVCGLNTKQSLRSSKLGNFLVFRFKSLNDQLLTNAILIETTDRSIWLMID